MLAALAVLFGSCGGDGGATSEPLTSGPADLTGQLTIVAASSLTDAFIEIGQAFEARHDDVNVVITFDGSARLATAIREGAPADVFASADEATLAGVAADGLTRGSPATFATNVLQIVVPEGNPLAIGSLADLLGPDVKLSLCGLEVPCGKYAERAFSKAGLPFPRAGAQENVKGVLTQVQLGEADAGLVYVTDVLAADDVEGIDLTEGQRAVVRYPASVLADAAEPDLASAFLEFLVGPEARSILLDLGFGLP